MRACVGVRASSGEHVFSNRQMPSCAPQAECGLVFTRAVQREGGRNTHMCTHVGTEGRRQAHVCRERACACARKTEERERDSESESESEREHASEREREREHRTHKTPAAPRSAGGALY